MLYFEIVSSIALAFGLIAGNLLGAAEGMATATTAAGVKPPVPSGQPHSTMDFILNIFPGSFIGAFAKGELLQVLVIALIFGAGLLHLKADKRAPIERGLNTISDAFFEFIHIIMWFAPLDTFGAVAFAVGSSGTAVLLSLIYLVLSFYAVVSIFIAVVLGTICALFKINLFRFLGYIKDEIYIVLGTASSESVLPRLLEKLLLEAERRPRAAHGLRLQPGRPVDLHVDGRTLPLSISASSSASSS
jgi:aerobic C4-dicarboxylate transport protein